MKIPDTHVIPINDMKKHIESRDCWCNPQLKEEDITRLQDPSKEIAVIVIHNSMDGRELIERHGIN